MIRTGRENGGERKPDSGKDAADKKMKRMVVRNWIIMFVSLALVIICYYFVR